MRVSFLILFTLILFIGCTEELMDPYQPGAIEGFVRLSADDQAGDYDLSGIEVSISGSNLSAITTPNGYFIILNVPEGIYELYAKTVVGRDFYDLYTDPVEVNAGETSLAPEVIFNVPRFIIWNFILMDELYVWYGSSFSTEIITNVRDYRVMGAARSARYEAPLDTSVTVWHNGARVVLDAPKNAFQTSISLVDGYNRVEADVGDVMVPGFGSDSIFIYYTPTQTSLYIRLHWKTIDYDSVSAGDLDLALINSVTADTCWYGNYNPDWGSKTARIDNPQLFDRINPYGNNDAVESLRLDCIPNGEYKIEVHYRQNLDSDTVQVLANMEYSLNGVRADSIWADPPMRLGETWLAGTFTIDNSIEWDD